MGKMMRDPAAITLRSDYGTDRGVQFASDLAALRDDVCTASRGTLADTVVIGFIFRAARLRRSIANDVGRPYRVEARLALDIICMHLCGITAEEADRREREHALAAGRGVPAETGSMLGGAVVSGGLPTLGRRRR